MPEIRFEFGKNWSKFLALVNEERITAAETHTLKALGLPSLKGTTFLDIGCGSGLFSLAASRLGARVHSFDYDPMSVRATGALKSKFAMGANDWDIEQGSVLDERFMAKLGMFDIVYSWGVLHHTGSLWKALALAGAAVNPKGLLYIAIYNDQGATSQRWKAIKKFYSGSPKPLQWAVLAQGLAFLQMKFMGGQVLRGKSPFHFLGTPAKERLRGMSAWHDLVDWMGGYPFEVAKPEEIINFYKDKGFELTYQTTVGTGLGCNEFVFKKR